jgi:tetratricopeptide (TPR) repeat protein
VTDTHQSGGTGLVAGRDAHLSGGLVAGRDLNVQIVRPAPPIMPGPFQLPRDTDDFTDRDAAVEELSRLLGGAQEGNGASVVVSAIAGKAGVGKTALATKVAHRLHERFPDGQLYVNLRGGEDQWQDPALVLGEFLLSLGVARASIPEDFEQRAARYRTQLAGHRILVVLDNAVDEAQVRPLLPGSPGSAALITSRTVLTGLPGVHPFNLDVLELEQGVELLARIAGRKRIDAEPQEAERIVRLCGYLPLAVRIAGAKLAARRHWTLRMLANRLANDHNLLSELKLRDLEVRASFELSYRDLEETERRAFRLLPLLKAPDFTAWVASALLNCELVEAEDVLDRLVDAQVLEGTSDPESGEVRYRFHDLLRAFARERLWSEEPAALQEAALHRALDAHVVLAEYAAGLLEPGSVADIDDVWWLSTRSRVIAERVAADPGAWFSAERVNLISVMEQADEHQVLDVVWRLARSLNYFFKLRSHWSDWGHTQKLALRAARRAGNRAARASALRSLGDVSTQRKQFRGAVRRFQGAMHLFHSLADERGAAWTDVGIGNAYLDNGRFSEALGQFERGLRQFESIGDPRGKAWALLSSGICHRFQGRLGDAKTCFEDSLPLVRRLQDRRGEAYCLVNLGIVHWRKGQFEVALTFFDQARPIFRELVDHHGETFVLLAIGHMHRERGDLDEAVAVLDTCLATFQEFGEREGEALTRLNLGMVWQVQGRLDEAVARFHQCLAMFHELEDPRGTAWTLLGLGEAYRQQERFDDALACLDRSLEIFDGSGEQLGRAKVLSSRGLVLEGRGEQRLAIIAWREAVKIFRELGAPESSKVETWLRDRDNGR